MTPLEIAQDMQKHIDQTRAWRNAPGMKQATDTSLFSGVTTAGLLQIEARLKPLIDALEQEL